MATESGYSNQKKYGPNQFKTIQTLGSDKFGEATSMMGQYPVTTGINIDLAVLSTDGKVYTVKVDAHGARIGDYLRIETGDSAGWDYDIIELAGVDYVRVNATLLPPVGESAGIYRPIPLGLDATGGIVITPPAGGATEAKQDAQIVLATSANTKLDTIIAKDFATSAKQDTGNTSLGSIDTKLSSQATAAKQDLLLAELQLKADLTETQPVSLASVPLPTGAATEATLSSIDGKVPANLTVSATRLLVDGSGVTQPISAAALPLPTGAATEAKQDTQITELQDIEADVEAMSAKLPATLGQKTSANSLAVVMASDQSAISVTQSALAVTFQEDATVTTVAETFTAPAGAKSCVIQAPSSNTVNLRVRLSGTATTSSGYVFEPGRSEAFPFASDISYIAESSSGQSINVHFGT